MSIVEKIYQMFKEGKIYLCVRNESFNDLDFELKDFNYSYLVKIERIKLEYHFGENGSAFLNVVTYRTWADSIETLVLKDEDVHEIIKETARIAEKNKTRDYNSFLYWTNDEAAIDYYKELLAAYFEDRLTSALQDIKEERRKSYTGCILFKDCVNKRLLLIEENSFKGNQPTLKDALLSCSTRGLYHRLNETGNDLFENKCDFFLVKRGDLPALLTTIGLHIPEIRIVNASTEE